MKQKIIGIGLITTLIFGLSACVNIPYRAPIQQGNVIEANRAKLIQEGMSKTQIAETLGTPIIQHVFHQDRWDYIYRLDEHVRPAHQEHLTIWFNNDLAIKVERKRVMP